MRRKRREGERRVEMWGGGEAYPPSDTHTHTTSRAADEREKEIEIDTKNV